MVSCHRDSAQLKLRPTSVRLALAMLVARDADAVGRRPAGAGAAAHGEAGAAHGEAAHEESIWPFVGKIVNFAVLVGTLVYFLRTPLANYLASPQHPGARRPRRGRGR